MQASIKETDATRKKLKEERKGAEKRKEEVKKYLAKVKEDWEG